MSRTWKKYTGGCFRSPKGHRQAVIAGVRSRAVPPDPWDDVAYDKQCNLPFKVAAGMLENGVHEQDVVRHLMRKFGVRLNDAEWITALSRPKEPRSPEGLLRVRKEKNVILIRIDSPVV